MSTDQPRLAKSRLLVAEAFERDRTATTRPDPHDLGTWLLEQLQANGWTPPRDLTDTPPLRPDRVATDAERRAAMTQIRAVLNPTTREVHAPH